MKAMKMMCRALVMRLRTLAYMFTWRDQDAELIARWIAMGLQRSPSDREEE